MTFKISNIEVWGISYPTGLEIRMTTEDYVKACRCGFPPGTEIRRYYTTKSGVELIFPNPILTIYPEGKTPAGNNRDYAKLFEWKGMFNGNGK